MINYSNIALAIDKFKELGYQYVETPWLVGEDIDMITKPKDIPPLRVNPKNKNLVASAEQGFLYNTIKGYMPEGKFISAGPCFRDETYDVTHKKQFFKVEAFINVNVNKDNLMRLMDNVLDLYIKHFGVNENELKVLEILGDDGNLSYDIALGDDRIELGSYGIRNHKGISWIYGTVIAEPRFSSTIKSL